MWSRKVSSMGKAQDVELGGFNQTSPKIKWTGLPQKIQSKIFKNCTGLIFIKDHVTLLSVAIMCGNQLIKRKMFGLMIWQVYIIGFL